MTRLLKNSAWNTPLSILSTATLHHQSPLQHYDKAVVGTPLNFLYMYLDFNTLAVCLCVSHTWRNAVPKYISNIISLVMTWNQYVRKWNTNRNKYIVRPRIIHDISSIYDNINAEDISHDVLTYVPTQISSTRPKTRYIHPAKYVYDDLYHISQFDEFDDYPTSLIDHGDVTSMTNIWSSSICHDLDDDSSMSSWYGIWEMNPDENQYRPHAMHVQLLLLPRIGDTSIPIGCGRFYSIIQFHGLAIHRSGVWCLSKDARLLRLLYETCFMDPYQYDGYFNPYDFNEWRATACDTFMRQSNDVIIMPHPHLHAGRVMYGLYKNGNVTSVHVHPEWICTCTNVRTKIEAKTQTETETGAETQIETETKTDVPTDYDLTHYDMFGYAKSDDPFLSCTMTSSPWIETLATWYPPRSKTRIASDRYERFGGWCRCYMHNDAIAYERQEYERQEYRSKEYRSRRCEDDQSVDEEYEGIISRIPTYMSRKMGTRRRKNAQYVE